MTVWEYKVLEPDMKIRDRIEVVEREFNRLGEDGWELCSDHGGSHTLKRPPPGTASCRRPGAIAVRQQPGEALSRAGRSCAARGPAAMGDQVQAEASVRGVAAD